MLMFINITHKETIMAKHNLVIPSNAGKRSPEQLERLQKLPLVQKIELTKRRIAQWYEMHKGMVYVSFSGGKDSTVLTDLVWQDFPHVPAVFSNTGLEYPEIVAFVKRVQKKGRPVDIVRPRKSFKHVIEQHGWPVVSKKISTSINRYRNTPSPEMREYYLTGHKKGIYIGNAGVISKKHQYLIDAPFEISEKCCDVLKKGPFKQYSKATGRVPITGTMAEESAFRRKNWLDYGCNMFDKAEPISAPISFWTEQDVLHYIVSKNIDYCHEIYGKIVPKPIQQGSFLEPELPELKCEKAQRTGCMWCLLGLEYDTDENGENRFTRMKEEHPKQYDIIINKFGAGKVLDYMGQPY
jgi:3'-phosphoadenosine 5'-phosphosulfate sulfotransferase (PAPS reductase)/FAD synthetase